MGELEQTKKEIQAYCKDKFFLFEVDGDPLTDIIKNSITWSGDDYKEFLGFAEKFNPTLIYYQESFGDEKHEEDIASIELGFITNGIMHIFTTDASWYEPEYIDDEEDEKVLEKLGKMSAEEIAKDMVAFANKQFPDSLDFFEIRNAFLAENGTDRFGVNMDANLRVKIDKADRLAQQQIMQAVVKKEKEELPKIVEECVKWAKENGFNKLTRSNLDAFLLEKSMSFSNPTHDALYIKVNFELKKKPI